MRAAEAASLIARSGAAQATGTIDLTTLQVAPLYDQSRHDHAPAARYVDLLERADRRARADDPRIVAVNAHVADELQDVWIATSEGRFVHDHRPMVTLGVQVVASAHGQRGSGYAADGGRIAIDYFDTHSPEELAADAARRAGSGLVTIAALGSAEVYRGGSPGILVSDAPVPDLLADRRIKALRHRGDEAGRMCMLGRAHHVCV